MWMLHPGGSVIILSCIVNYSTGVKALLNMTSYLEINMRVTRINIKLYWIEKVTVIIMGTSINMTVNVAINLNQVTCIRPISLWLIPIYNILYLSIIVLTVLWTSIAPTIGDLFRIIGHKTHTPIIICLSAIVSVTLPWPTLAVEGLWM